MSSETELELYRSLRQAQERFVYFMLAAAGAAIAFAVTQTQNANLSWAQLPLAVAVVCWGCSFFAGGMHLRYVSSNLYANFELLKIESGGHPQVGSHPQWVQAVSEGVREAIETNSNWSNFYAQLQFHMMVAGAIFFVIWDVFAMYLRTPK
jgi:hypothetical protein